MIAKIVQAQTELQAAFAKARSSSEQMAYADKEWRAILFSYEQLTRLLAAGANNPADTRLDYARFIGNYKALTDEIENLFADITSGWTGQSIVALVSELKPSYDRDALTGIGHLHIAAVLARGQTLKDIGELLLKLHRYAQYINAEGDPVADDVLVPVQPLVMPANRFSISSVRAL